MKEITRFIIGYKITISWNQPTEVLKVTMTSCTSCPDKTVYEHIVDKADFVGIGDHSGVQYQFTLCQETQFNWLSTCMFVDFINDRLKWHFANHAFHFDMTKIEDEMPELECGLCEKPSDDCECVNNGQVVEPDVSETKPSKTLLECKDEYAARQKAIKMLLKTFEAFPKSFASLTDVFWKSFFEENAVPFNDTILAKDYAWEFKIRIMIQRFSDLEQSEMCINCGKHVQCRGESRYCLNCIPIDEYRLGLIIENVNLNDVLSSMDKDTMLHLSTVGGTIPVSISVFQEHHNIKENITVGILDQIVLFYKGDQRLFYIRFNDAHAFYTFLCDQSGTTMMY